MHNFSAGPSILPLSVKEKAIEVLKGDVSLLEISHRSAKFGGVLEKTRVLTKKILELDSHEILFLHGGGRQQFLQIPYNLSQEFKTAYYMDTGSWANQAMHEATFFGEAKALTSSKEYGYRMIPKFVNEPKDAAYVYLTTNNTIFGTQYQDIPKTKAPLVADMSSDLFAKVYDFNQIDLIYAATQKNIGTAGCCLVAIRPEILKKPLGSLPTMIDYRTHINKKSLYSTPPVFAIIISLFMLEWMIELGGIAHFDQINKQKSQLLYDEIDRNSLFTPYAKKGSRSNVNVVFTAINEEVQDRFVEFANQQNIIGITGHRSIGGFRASMYNALPIKSVQVLVDAMQQFEHTLQS